MLHGPGNPRRDRVAQREPEHHADAAEDHAAPSDPADEGRQLAAGAADEEHPQNRTVAARQGNRVDCLRAIGPLDCLDTLLRLLPDARDHRLERGRLSNLPRGVDELLTRHLRLDVAIQQRPRARRQRERAKKLLIDPTAAGHVQPPLTCRDGPHGDETERRLARKLDRFEKGAGGRRSSAGHPRMLVAEPGRPLRGRDDRAVGRHDVEEVESMRRGERRSIVDKCRAIRAGCTEIDRRAPQGIARRHSLDPHGHVVALAGKLAPEFCDERRRPLRVERLERAPRACRYRPCGQHHARRDDGADEGEKAGAEAHGLSALIQRLPKSHAPDGRTAGAFQASTCAASAESSGR